MTQVDVMVLATHPDDAEIACGGTIMKLVAQGRRVGIVDMTRGEMSTRGTPDQRAEETAAATKLLGVQWRSNLGLPDTAVKDDDEALSAVVGAIRDLRPEILLAPLPKDAHPDHEESGKIARRAYFHAGLKNVFTELGAAFRPRLLIHYFSNDDIAPTFCVDISEHAAQKRKVVNCYVSQITMGDDDRGHLLRGLHLLERCEARDCYFGSICGCSAAEPFVVDGPLPLRDLAVLL